MRYLTGIHALSLKNNLKTPGNWSTEYMNWENIAIDIEESDESIFSDFGLEPAILLYRGESITKKANHIRAILDIIAAANDYTPRFMRCFVIDFLCTDAYNEILFEKVSLLSGNDNWKVINYIMTEEFSTNWKYWKVNHNIK
jgi:hypothetical protein